MIPNRIPSCRCAGFAAMLVVVAVGSAAAQEPVAPEEREQKEHAARLKAIVAGFRIYRTPDRLLEAALVPDPVLRYADSTRRTQESMLWIWGPTGRPAAIVAIEHYPERGAGERWLYEIASLSTNRIAVDRAQDMTWTADGPGLELHAIDGGPPVAERPARRLAQMRELQRRFSAHERATVEGRIELRPLTSPLHRYEQKEQNVIDGAIFAFANGANPEVLLVLEAHRENAQEAQWRFGFAQMTGEATTAELDGKTVWRREGANPPATRAAYKNGWLGDDAAPSSSKTAN
jgi:hypothetical protein